jgi:hypothetical protein
MKNKFVMTLSALIIGLLAFSLTVNAVPAQAKPSQVVSAPMEARIGGQNFSLLADALQAPQEQDGRLLENFLVRENLALNNQQNRLELAHTIAEDTQKYIDNQKSRGNDTSTLETALAAFNQEVSSAEANHTAAASLLANPAGFDEAGQVTDRDTALQTIRDAGHLLRQAHLTITQATLDLKLALQSYRGN